MPATIPPAHKEQFLAADGPILTNTPPLAARGQPWRARGAVEILISRNQEMPSYGYGPGWVGATPFFGPAVMTGAPASWGELRCCFS
jgi:hypothetical protein